MCSRAEDDEEALKWAAIEKLPTYLRKGEMTELILIFPRIEVRFDQLSVDAETYVCNRGVPTIFTFTVNILEGFLNSLHILPNTKRPLPILHEISGIVKPGRMTLLFGPPVSGKTTLLLALAGKLDRDHKFVPQRASAYISQNGLHIGEVTVRETLAFSARYQGVGPKYAELSEREKEANIKPDPDVDIFMKILGLDIGADTLVGDEMFRGISDGQ
ncbi:hypothetical protein KY290_027998 [Solanum tuberosum]|uniref:ABC transporter domain-containing protein n=1 Tax=Solanum tuberosum TaxID=4113 RepID=A0ABQ7UGL9_SOLTU|nr:hypothetical protein KY285_026974 [Solanum tuberosum]KAH0748766.1 hypothetical protein KY290_027998 [Solanum tuberosum]